MLMVGQAASSPRAWIILSKKPLSTERPTGTQMSKLMLSLRIGGPLHGRLNTSRDTAFKAEDLGCLPLTHILRKMSLGWVGSSALVQDYDNELEFYYLSTRLTNTDSIKRSCLRLPKLTPTLFYVPLPPLHSVQVLQMYLKAYYQGNLYPNRLKQHHLSCHDGPLEEVTETREPPTVSQRSVQAPVRSCRRSPTRSKDMKLQK